MADLNNREEDLLEETFHEEIHIHNHHHSIKRKKENIYKRIKKKMPSPIILNIMAGLIIVNLIFYYFSTPIIKERQESINKYSYDNIIKTKENEGLLAEIKKTNDAYYSDILYKFLPVEKLTDLAKLSWGYSLKVNNLNVEKKNANSIDAKSSDIKIVLVEQMINDNMPEDVARLGSLSGGKYNFKLEDSFKITGNNTKYTYDEKKEGSKLIATYTFSDVPEGEIITIQISTNLKNQLKLDNEIIEVFNSKV